MAYTIIAPKSGMRIDELPSILKLRGDNNTNSQEAPFRMNRPDRSYPNGNDLAYQKLLGNHIRPYSISFLYLNRFGVISPKRFFLFSSYSV